VGLPFFHGFFFEIQFARFLLFEAFSITPLSFSLLSSCHLPPPPSFDVALLTANLTVWCKLPPLPSDPSRSPPPCASRVARVFWPPSSLLLCPLFPFCAPFYYRSSPLETPFFWACLPTFPPPLPPPWPPPFSFTPFFGRAHSPQKPFFRPYLRGLGRAEPPPLPVFFSPNLPFFLKDLIWRTIDAFHLVLLSEDLSPFSRFYSPLFSFMAALVQVSLDFNHQMFPFPAKRIADSHLLLLSIFPPFNVM